MGKTIAMPDQGVYKNNWAKLGDVLKKSNKPREITPCIWVYPWGLIEVITISSDNNLPLKAYATQPVGGSIEEPQTESKFRYLLDEAHFKDPEVEVCCIPMDSEDWDSTDEFEAIASLCAYEHISETWLQLNDVSVNGLDKAGIIHEGEIPSMIEKPLEYAGPDKMVPELPIQVDPNEEPPAIEWVPKSPTQTSYEACKPKSRKNPPIVEVKTIQDYLDTQTKPKDPIHNPSHYTKGLIETIEVIEKFELDFHLGNAFKYISRAGDKEDQPFLKDIQKAIWYLKRAKEFGSEVKVNFNHNGNENPVQVYLETSNIGHLRGRAIIYLLTNNLTDAIADLEYLSSLAIEYKF